MAFPDAVPGLQYLTEGGQETEVMFKHGFDLPEFAMFTLLDDPAAVERLRAMYAAYLETAVRHGFGVLVGGLDYRASPGWAGKVGYEGAALADVQHRCIDFLRTAVAPYAADLPDVRIAGLVGPRADAYSTDETISEDEAEEYHGHQLRTLAEAGVDLVEAMTFAQPAEAIGLARAAAAVGLPASVSFVLGSDGRLLTGPTVREAIAEVDLRTGDDRPAFYGMNCSHPLELEPALEPGDWFRRVRCLRPNAVRAEKVALCTLGHLESGDPAELGALMGELARTHDHLDIWGGCCGTWDAHLDAIATNVVAARRG